MMFLAGVHEITERMNHLDNVVLCLIVAVVVLSVGLIVCLMKKEKK